MSNNKSTKKIRKEQNAVLNQLIKDLKSGKYSKEDLPNIKDMLVTFTETEKNSLVTFSKFYGVFCPDRQKVLATLEALKTKYPDVDIANMHKEIHNIRKRLAQLSTEEQGENRD